MKAFDWFFEITRTAKRRGERFRDDDRPSEETFRQLLLTTLLKTRQDDRAKEGDLQSSFTDYVGHVQASTNAQVKNRQARPYDRTLVVQPHQVPDLTKLNEASLLITDKTYFDDYQDNVVVLETDNTKSYTEKKIGIADNFMSYLSNAFNTITSKLKSLTSEQNTLSSNLQQLQSAVDDLLNLFAGESGSLSTKDFVPVGATYPFAGTSVPNDKYMFAEGQTLDTSTYSDLFNVLGYTYGGSGSSFNLPDFRDRVARGADDTNAVGVTAGQNSVLLSVNNIPNHTHSDGSLSLDFDSESSLGFAKAWSQTSLNQYIGAGNNGDVTTAAGTDSTVGTTGAGDTEVDVKNVYKDTNDITITGNTGNINGKTDTDSVDTRDKFLAIKYIIKVQ